MKTKTLAAALLLLAALATAEPPAIPQGNDIPTNLRLYFVAFLVADSVERAPADDVFREHLAYIHRQVDAGKYLLVGPLKEPAVQAGRFSVEVHPALLSEFPSVVRY